MDTYGNENNKLFELCPDNLEHCKISSAKTNMKGSFKVWRLYVKQLVKEHPDKSLKWLLSVYHKNHKHEWEKFKKNPKFSI